MNALTPFPKRWDYRSAVTECTECNGCGEVCVTPFHTHPNDPDRCDRVCPNCCGAGHHACKVCGFDIVVPGYDCLVCFTTNELPAHLLTDQTATDIGAALAQAFKARVA